jgi:hypothetical protein
MNPGAHAMAKLFYTLEEAAAKLKKSPEEVSALVENGQLQEFRDRDKVMLKVDQVDLLAGGAGDEDVIPLAESGELGSISLASDSGSGMNLESPKEQTGISIFDADQTEEADPSAVTQITERAPSELSLETVGSGSGLMDLTREADDTSLGQDLLADVETPKEDGSTAHETMAEEGAGDAGALFESGPAESELAGAGAGGVAPMMVAAEPYDGTWSGLSGGVALGMVFVAAFAVALVIFGLNQGGSGNVLVNQIATNLWMYVGIAGGVILLPAIIGLFVGRKA